LIGSLDLGYQPLYMRRTLHANDALKAARHKIFHGKPSFSDKKKVYPKSRFCELTTDETQEIMDKAVADSKQQKKAESSG